MFSIEPFSPRRRATRVAKKRYPTPWTFPWILMIRCSLAMCARLYAITGAVCGLLFPTELPYQRHELGRAAVFDLQPGADAHDAGQALVAFRTDGDDELAGAGELLEERLGHLGSGGGDDDAIERRLVRPAVGAVEYFHRGVVDFEGADQLRRAQRQLVYPLD